mmetsp:Transcript_43267/g.41650  ORF Transcript_43267/g.41650 Transcript_43267/m.41650 type:complete len:83 (-) Transcript_43267:245-493(-)
MSEEEIEEIRKSLMETEFFDINSVDVSADEKKKLTKLSLTVVFEKGEILLQDNASCIVLFQELLIIKTNVKRDSSFDFSISN